MTKTQLIELIKSVNLNFLNAHIDFTEVKMSQNFGHYEIKQYLLASSKKDLCSAAFLSKQSLMMTLCSHATDRFMTLRVV